LRRSSNKRAASVSRRAGIIRSAYSREMGGGVGGMVKSEREWE